MLLKKKRERLINYLETYKSSNNEMKRILPKLLVINKLKSIQMLYLLNHYGE